MKTRKNRLIGLTVGSLSRSFIYKPLAVLRAILLPPAPKSPGGFAIQPANRIHPPIIRRIANARSNPCPLVTF